MKNKLKLYLTLWVVLFTFLNVNAQCEIIMKFFKDDVYTSKELVAFAEKDPQKAFDSWKVLYNEKTGFTKSIEELNLIFKNLDEINAIGYSKWKAVNGAGSLVKDIISKRVIKTISKYDKNLGKMVDYPMYNNVALGKSSGGSLKQFGDEVGANFWTKETDNVLTSMYNLPERDYFGGFERSIGEVLDATTGANQGKILFDVTRVNVQKAVTGGMVHNPALVLDGFVTELELQLLMRNKTWFDNIIFHEGGKILNTQELTTKGVKFLGQ